jgi:hypothetical protein
VPWKLRNIWKNCLHIANSMNFLVTHGKVIIAVMLD